MIDAAVMQMRDWLEDDATGVNAQILAMPLDDPLAPDAPPTLRAIYAETDHAWVARTFQGQLLRRMQSTDAPALMVGVASAVAGDLRPDTPGVGRVTVDVGICYVGRSDRSEELVRDARQTFRACMRAIAAPFAEDMGRVFTRAGVDVEHPSAWRYATLAGADADSIIYGALIVSVPTADPWALGITA